MGAVPICVLCARFKMSDLPNEMWLAIADRTQTLADFLNTLQASCGLTYIQAMSVYLGNPRFKFAPRLGYDVVPWSWQHESRADTFWRAESRLCSNSVPESRVMLQPRPHRPIPGYSTYVLSWLVNCQCWSEQIFVYVRDVNKSPGLLVPNKCVYKPSPKLAEFIQESESLFFLCTKSRRTEKCVHSLTVFIRDEAFSELVTPDPDVCADKECALDYSIHRNVHTK